jgi:hypothetical protein
LIIHEGAIAALMVLHPPLAAFKHYIKMNTAYGTINTPDFTVFGPSNPKGVNETKIAWMKHTFFSPYREGKVCRKFEGFIVTHRIRS